MSKEAILKFVYFLCTIPFNLIAMMLFLFNAFHVRDKLNKCIQEVDQRRSEVPDKFISYLIVAEDHRSLYHYGIDPVGMLRALYARVFSNEIQGASTIEQQFVRVVTAEYAYSLIRKFKEQVLAVLLVNRRSKADIAKAYLAIAYYGTLCEGSKGILSQVGCDLQLISENQIISMVARLKYPKPLKNIESWEKKYLSRVIYIKDRHKKSFGT
ncbi:hypothetical protein JCM30760_21220 [Thiomicrorhabdus hydrogeniphila]